MQMPRGMARFNKVVTNRVAGKVAPYVPPYAEVIHVGRKSGRTYRQPVTALRSGSTLAVALFYGEDSDWVRNALTAGEAGIRRGGQEFTWAGLRIVEPTEPGLPASARVLGRLAGSVLVGQIERR